MFNFILGLIIGAGIVLVLMKNRDSSSQSSKNDRSTVINPEQGKMKRENLEKVLEIAREKGEITNDDAEHALGVSNATAERYLDELEKQGKLVQIGDTGRGVTYRLN